MIKFTKATIFRKKSHLNYRPEKQLKFQTILLSQKQLKSRKIIFFKHTLISQFLIHFIEV